MISGNSLRNCRSHRPSVQRSRTLNVVCSIRARWCIDVRYGCKQDATALLQEWVKEIGSQVGLNASNTRLSTGSIGVPESRLELEVTFNNLAEWEQFLGSIPFKDHKAWSQRIQSMVTNDDSPKWEVFRAVPVDMDTTPAAGSTTSAIDLATSPAQLWGFAPQSETQPKALSSPFSQTVVGNRAGTAASSPPSSLTLIEDSAAAEVVLDWKGDPMQINPGDKLPFKFL